MKTHRYPKTLKLNVIRDKLIGGLSVTEIIIKYRGPTPSTIYRWIKLYGRDIIAKNVVQIQVIIKSL